MPSAIVTAATATVAVAHAPKEAAIQTPAAAHDDPQPDANQRNTLAAELYAPIICPEHADDALNTIAGIDGTDALG